MHVSPTENKWATIAETLTPPCISISVRVLTIIVFFSDIRFAENYTVLNSVFQINI